jgi:cobalt-zinc-cadmium efflux system protein
LVSLGHGHDHGRPAEIPGRGGLLAAALALVLAFMVGEVVAGLLSGSLALLSDAGHMLTDAAALGLALLAAHVARRPPRGAFTYGFARIDALSGQANGITLILLALWFVVEAVRRLIDPPAVAGGVVTGVALAGVAVNAAATALTTRAARHDSQSLNLRGVVAHLVTDLYAFAATLMAGLIVLTSGWTRADPIASLVIAAVMAWTGWRLTHAAGRIFLEAAPAGVDPQRLGEDLAGVGGVAELHDLHVWQLGPGQAAMSAHVLVEPADDCHDVSRRLRERLLHRYGIGHVTLQTDHADDRAADGAAHDAQHCTDTHGNVHVPPGG